MQQSRQGGTMHLRRLEIFGFKSFAEDVRIEMPPGLTVLVGPNGGGKSNVVDAIRWALGEQRLRELRAERWEDLIYSGNGRRAPAQLAEVFLEFDNHDGTVAEWPEVLRIGRRLFRNGDSEYVVGHRTVRLKDVTELFLDSGLGRAAYAIIGQGRVEAALLQKPGERLEQLEEAAGTTRYKVRRRETLSHLEAATAELRRVSDLVNEVDRERQDVEEQAERERAYLVRETERQELKRGLVAARRLELTGRVDELRRQLESGAAARAGLLEEAARLREAIDAMEATLPEDEATAADILGQSLERERERERWRGRVDSLVHQQSDWETTLSEAEAELKSLGADPTPEVLEEPEDPRPALRKEIEQAAAARAKRAIELGQARDARQRARERLARAQEAGRGWLQLSEQLRALTGEEVNAPGALRQAIRARAEDAQAEMVSVDAELVRVRDEAGRLRQEVRRQAEQLEFLRHQTAERQARRRVLEQLQAEGDGYSQGVRAVLQASGEGRLEGIVGALGTLLEVERPYRAALQAALGGHAQDLVTADERRAREAVQYLQQSGRGRATFLPLDTVRPGMPNRQDLGLSREAGAIGWLMDLIHIEDRLRVAAAHVLGRVLVASTLSDAVAIGRLAEFRYRIVTLDGQLVQPGGAITGGAAQAQNQVWVRRQEIEQLTTALADAAAQLSAVEVSLAGAVEAAEAAEGQVEERSQERREAQQRLSEAMYLLSMVERILPTDVPDPDPDRLREEEAAAMAVLAEAESAVGAQEAAMREAEQAVTRLEATLDRVEADWAEREGLYAARRAAAAQDVARRSALQERIARLRQSIQDQSGLLEEARGHVARLSEELQDLNDQLAVLRQAQQDAQQDLTGLRERLRALELELRRSEHRAEVEQAELADKQAEWERLSQDPDAQSEPVADVRQAQRRLGILEQEIAAMPPVATGSLAMYEALSSRAAFLERERLDVERAVAELTATLKDLDAEVRLRRRETAAVVERAFHQSVVELFGGGSGGFRYLDEPDPGLELWVQPPGKQPQSLALLSGGEKALGALAWLFSLLEVKPAPLVVLDEVEASLDELNARRFAQYLARRRRSQYVVVSHHKPTMEQADALWGFTSDGRGITRLVSVRLQAADEVM
jgi:chromosome segregation protein